MGAGLSRKRRRKRETDDEEGLVSPSENNVNSILAPKLAEEYLLFQILSIECSRKRNIPTLHDLCLVAIFTMTWRKSEVEWKQMNEEPSDFHWPYSLWLTVIPLMKSSRASIDFLSLDPYHFVCFVTQFYHSLFLSLTDEDIPSFIRERNAKLSSSSSSSGLTSVDHDSAPFAEVALLLQILFSSWFTYQLLRHRSHQQRQKVAAKLHMIADHSLSLRNFPLLLSVYLAFQKFSVVRIQSLSTLKDYPVFSLFSPARGYLSFRSHFSSSPSPKLPLLNIFFADISYILDGYQDSSQASKVLNDVIGRFKGSMIGEYSDERVSQSSQSPSHTPLPYSPSLEYDLTRELFIEFHSIDTVDSYYQYSLQILPLGRSISELDEIGCFDDVRVSWGLSN
jgi:hypothetical protein